MAWKPIPRKLAIKDLQNGFFELSAERIRPVYVSAVDLFSLADQIREFEREHYRRLADGLVVELIDQQKSE